MKKLFTLLTIVLMCKCIANAQDIIVMNNDSSEEVLAKVIEITDEVIKYKRWSYLDGPTYTTSISKIASIKYQNGEEQKFGRASTSSKAISTNNSTQIATSQENAIAAATDQPKKNDQGSEKPVEPKGVENIGGLDASVNSNSSADKKDTWFNNEKGTSIFYGDVYYALPIGNGDFDSSFFLGMNLCYGYNVIDNLFVMSGLGYTTGFVKSGYSTISETTINLPIQSGYNLPIGSLCSFDFKTGPQLKYAVAGKYEYRYGSTHETVKYKDMADVKRFGLDWSIGVSFYIAEYGIMAEYAFDLLEGDGGSGFLKLGVSFRY